MAPKIYFENKSFLACVEDNNGEPLNDGDFIVCTPVVFDDLTTCGVGIFFPDGSGQVWGLLHPRDLISSWRATEILRQTDEIRQGTLFAAYHAAKRADRRTDHEQEVVNALIKKIGRLMYNQIMNKPVPEEIIRAILDNQDNEGLKPNLWPITEEVRAGTVVWRMEFAKFGIKHPDQVDAEIRWQEAVIARYDRLLTSYAAYCGKPRQCLGMEHIEGALLHLVKEGAEEHHRDEVIVAVAATAGHLTTAEFALGFVPFGVRTESEFHRLMSQERDKALTVSATWMRVDSSWVGRSWDFLVRLMGENPSPFGAGETKEILSQLLVQYFPQVPEPDPDFA